MQYGNLVNAARLDAVEATIGINPKLRIYEGTQPSDINTAASGTLIVDMDLTDQSGNWMANAVSARPATKGKNGVWSGLGHANAGAGKVAGYFRITNTAGTVAGIQGSCGQGGGELSFDNATIANGQTVTVNSFNLQSNQ